ncbi:MAG: hypothetical protein JNM84_09035 [Planctomycetes bacterium]|nr:hypothetical protein [Planctomycetota bacterium]
MNRLSYDLPQILLLDCAGLLSGKRLRELEAQGARVLRCSDPCEALEHLVLRRFDALWIALADGERAGVLLIEELDRDPLLQRGTLVVEVEELSDPLAAHLLRHGVDHVFSLGAMQSEVAEALLGAVPSAVAS